MKFILQNTHDHPGLNDEYIKTLEKLNIKYEIVISPWNVLHSNGDIKDSNGCIIEINTLKQLDELSNNVPSLIYNDTYSGNLYPKDKYSNIKAIEIYDDYKE